MCCDLIEDRSRRAFELLREHHVVIFPRSASSNMNLLNLFHKRYCYTAGVWVRVYNAGVTLRQGSSKRIRDPRLSSNCR